PVAACLVYQPFADIYSAIRSQEHVLEANQSVVFPQAEAVVNRVNSLVGQVLKQPLAHDSLTALANQTSDFLEQSGLSSSRSFKRLKMAAKLQQAFQPDSLNRLNPGATRYRLRSAYLQAVKQMIFSGKVSDKFTLNLAQLQYEQAIERWALAETYMALKHKLLWHAAIDTGRARTPLQAQLLNDIVKDIADGLLTIPRVKPYLPIARAVSIGLVGCPPEQVDINRQIIDDDQRFNRLLTQSSVHGLFDTGQFSQAGDRIKAIAKYIGSQSL
ncbi:MAG: hypothetical protein U1C50_01790, partial [Patescibacteria group bacterium]|nr:hypothetical protein [Patescibacteria group bacterium]